MHKFLNTAHFIDDLVQSKTDVYLENFRRTEAEDIQLIWH